MRLTITKKKFIFKIQPTKEPIYFKGSKYYVRRGTSNHNCTAKETQGHIKSRSTNTSLKLNQIKNLKDR